MTSHLYLIHHYISLNLFHLNQNNLKLKQIFFTLKKVIIILILKIIFFF